MNITNAQAATKASPVAAVPLFGWQRYAPNKQRQPRRLLGDDGDDLVHMPLKGGAVAVLDAADFDGMVARGITTQWRLASSGNGYFYVRAYLPGATSLVMVSRLLLDVPSGKIVRHADRNPLNLRRKNLVLDDGYSKQREKVVKVSREEPLTF